MQNIPNNRWTLVSASFTHFTLVVALLIARPTGDQPVATVDSNKPQVVLILSSQVKLCHRNLPSGSTKLFSLRLLAIDGNRT
jgi:hypothetical protein